RVVTVGCAVFRRQPRQRPDVGRELPQLVFRNAPAKRGHAVGTTLGDALVDRRAVPPIDPLRVHQGRPRGTATAVAMTAAAVVPSPQALAARQRMRIALVVLHAVDARQRALELCAFAPRIEVTLLALA